MQAERTAGDAHKSGSPGRPQGVPPLNIAAAVEVALQDSFGGQSGEGNGGEGNEGKSKSPWHIAQGPDLSCGSDAAVGWHINQGPQGRQLQKAAGGHGEHKSTDQEEKRQIGKESSVPWHISSPPPQVFSDDDALVSLGARREPWLLSSSQPPIEEGVISVQAPSEAEGVPKKTRRGNGGSCCPTCSCGTVILWTIFMWVAYCCYELTNAFTPELCDPTKGTQTTRTNAERCILPLFGADQRVDVYLFSSTSSLFPDMTPSTHTPFWNATNLSMSVSSSSVFWGGGASADGRSWQASVPVPASVWHNNGSLFAHVVVVRAGKSPYLSEHTPIRAAGGAMSYEHVVTLTTPLTRHMKMAARHNVSMLVPALDARGLTPTSLPSEGEEGGVSRSGGAEWGASGGHELQTKDYPQMIAALLLAFVLFGAMRPSAAVAAARVGILAAAVALAHTLCVKFARERDATAAEAARSVAEEALAMLRDDRAPVTHWKPLLRVRYVVDHAAYPLGKWPLSHHVWHPRLGGLVEAYYDVVVLPESPDARMPQQPSAAGAAGGRRALQNLQKRVRFAPVVDADDFWPQRRSFWPVTPQTLEQPLRTRASERASESESESESERAARKQPPSASAAEREEDIWLALNVRLETMPLQHYQAWMYLEQVFRMMRDLGFQDVDLDDVKDILSESSLKVLVLTYAVIGLHVLFDVLAFKDDIGFFLGRESYAGLSSRSLMSSFICYFIQFLYLLDSDGTSRIVLISVFSSVCVEGWKAVKVTRAGIGLAYGLPWLTSLRGQQHHTDELQTDAFDAQGMRVLSFFLYPSVGAYGLYALVRQPHKGWWSWLINTAAYWVYTFQFLGMTPQLFVNYKLKSVAHLPWRPLMYKAFNTFIDDVFAWLIEMPLGHRIACLRDDVVFFVYLYQRYIYQVDKARPNEFGMAYELPHSPRTSSASSTLSAPLTSDTQPIQAVQRAHKRRDGKRHSCQL